MEGSLLPLLFFCFTVLGTYVYSVGLRPLQSEDIPRKARCKLGRFCCEERRGEQRVDRFCRLCCKESGDDKEGVPFFFCMRCVEQEFKIDERLEFLFGLPGLAVR